MINAILTGIINLIMGLVTLLLSPIDLAIQSLLPDLQGALNAVGAMFNYALTYVSYLVDMTCLSKETISFIILYFTFKLTAPLVFSTIKVALKWYNSLKI